MNLHPIDWLTHVQKSKIALIPDFQDSIIGKMINGEKGILIFDRDLELIYADLVGQEMDRKIGAQIRQFIRKQDDEIASTVIKNDSNLFGIQFQNLDLESKKYVNVVVQSLGDLQKYETDFIVQKNRLEMALYDTGLALFDHNLQNNTTSVNKNWLDMIEYTEEEFYPGLWFELIHPMDKSLVLKDWTDHIQGISQAYNSTFRIRTKNRSWRWAEGRGIYKFQGEDGVAERIIGFNRDVTETKNNENKLKLLSGIYSVNLDRVNAEERLYEILSFINKIIGVQKSLIFINDDRRQIFINNSVKEFQFEEINQRARQIHSQEQAFLRFPSRFTNEKYCLTRISDFGYIAVIEDENYWLSYNEEDLFITAGEKLGDVLERESLTVIAKENVLIEERQRVAREIHDSVTQTMYSLSLMANAGKDYSQLGDYEKVDQLFSKIGNYVQQGLLEMRLLVYELRPKALEMEGLKGAILKRLELLHNRGGIDFEFEYEISTKLSVEMESELHGLTQEAINNVVKHSGADKLKLRLIEERNNIIVEIEDNGIGCDLAHNSDDGIGIQSMKERIQRMKGRITFVAEPDQGFRIIADVPKQNQI
jgi:PAS domain S-box-containing protein